MTNQTPLNPDALEVAAKALYDHFKNQAANDGDSWPELEERDEVGHGIARDDAEVAVSAYLAVAQPVVNSVEELDALPMHSYVQGNDGFKHAKDWAGGWHLIVNRPSSAPHLSGSIDLPARVLYRPEVDS